MIIYSAIIFISYYYNYKQTHTTHTCRSMLGPTRHKWRPTSFNCCIARVPRLILEVNCQPLPKGLTLPPQNSQPLGPQTQNSWLPRARTQKSWLSSQSSGQSSQLMASACLFSASCGRDAKTKGVEVLNEMPPKRFDTSTCGLNSRALCQLSWVADLLVCKVSERHGILETSSLQHAGNYYVLGCRNPI